MATYCGFPVTKYLTNDSLQRWDAIAVGREVHLRCADRYRLQQGTGLHICHSDGQWKASTTCHVCDQGWLFFGSHCYFYNATKSSWNDAVLQCQAHSSYLLEINSSEENQWIVSTFLEVGVPDECRNVYICPVNAWIAGTDHDIEGRFRWNGKTDMTFTNWYLGQPDGGTPTQNCVQIMRNGFWDDYDCHFENSFICEHQ
ncbi:perlucin-like [Ostrea edulis]|uniref:perlucin-like n=1 Tax=Ostrea edulis TaxID=37623 RepID=UPI0024AF6AD6|nr:perlucin-like [Ostrea edulis]